MFRMILPVQRVVYYCKLWSRIKVKFFNKMIGLLSPKQLNKDCRIIKSLPI